MSPRVLSALLALVFAVSIADGLLRMPIQPTDSLELLLQAQGAPSAVAVFESTWSSPGYMRPMFRAQNKVLFDLAGDGAYQAVFRGFHAALMVALVMLFLAASRVRTANDAAAFAFGLVVLVGLHTFRGSVLEAYPVNHYLNVLVVCMLTLTLTQSKGSIWVDALAVTGFVYAALIIETGLLVWVIAVAAWAVGWRGVSARGLGVMSALLVGYAYLRFVHFSTGLPTLSERSTGYLLDVLDPRDLEQRFGGQPLWLYAYNVVTSALSVVLSEPRAGRFIAVRSWLDGTLVPRMPMAILTSLGTTIVIGAAALRRIRAREPFDDTGRVLAIGLAVLAANAVLSFAYTKDEIMMPAGAFYALASCAAVRDLLPRVGGAARPGAVILATVVSVLAVSWALRAAALPYVMRSEAFNQRHDWADTPRLWREAGMWPSEPAAAALIHHLRDEALATPIPNPRFEPTWLGLIWEP